MGQPSSRWAHDSGLSDVRKVRFCTVPTGARIAYASAGSGSALLVGAAWNSHLELLWQDPFAALRSGRLWLVLAACATTTGGVVSAYSFISPLLTDRAGGLVPLVLVGFGVGSLIGTVYGGRLGDVRPHATTVVVAAATTVVLIAICLLSAYAVPTVVLVALLGLIGLSASLVLSSLAVRFAAWHARWECRCRSRRTTSGPPWAPGSPASPSVPLWGPPARLWWAPSSPR